MSSTTHAHSSQCTQQHDDKLYEQHKEAHLQQAHGAGLTPVESDEAEELVHDTDVDVSERAHPLNVTLLPPLVATQEQPFLADGILLSNPASFWQKKAKFVCGGVSALQVIADFDRTLSTCVTKAGYATLSSHGVIESAKEVCDEYKQRILEVNDKYFPLEISHEISECDRERYMIEWWTQAHDLMIHYGMKKQYIEDAVRNCVAEGKIEMREESDVFFNTLNKYNVPLLIFSAGLGDCISALLNYYNLLFANVHIISNMMVFAESGQLVAFKSHIIHTLNKKYNELVPGTPFEHESKSRKNVLLLGDNLGDSMMSSGLEDGEGVDVIKVAFLHDNAAQRLALYKDKFDVVILNSCLGRDASLNFVNNIITEVCQSSAPTNSQ